MDEVTTHLSSFPPPPPSGMLGGSIPSPDPGGHQPGLGRRGGIWGRKSLCEDGEGWQGISKLPPAEALLLIAGPPISLALHPAARGGPPRHRGLGVRSSPMRTQEREPHGKRQGRARCACQMCPRGRGGRRRLRRGPPLHPAGPLRPLAGLPCPPAPGIPPLTSGPALAAWIAPRPRVPLSFSGQPGRGSSSGWGCAAPLARSPARPGPGVSPPAAARPALRCAARTRKTEPACLGLRCADAGGLLPGGEAGRAGELRLQRPGFAAFFPRRGFEGCLPASGEGGVFQVPAVFLEGVGPSSLPPPPGLSEGDRPRVYPLKVGLELSNLLVFSLVSSLRPRAGLGCREGTLCF